MLEVLAWAVRQKKEGGTKGIQPGKEDIKWFLFTDDTVFFIENLKDSATKQNTPRTNESSKPVGHEMNMQKKKKSLVFLNTNNEYRNTKTKIKSTKLCMLA